MLKYAGAAYLVFLGIRTLFFEKDPDPQAPTIEAQPLRRVFSQGVIVQILNPKTALFFFAYLPQFTNPARGSLVIQMLVLGMTFMSLAVISDSLYATLAGTVGKWLKGNRGFLRKQRLFSGTVYVGLGVLTAISGTRSTSS
jgi:threonine/homoserine/homoserine lactone efflux protein